MLYQISVNAHNDCHQIHPLAVSYQCIRERLPRERQLEFSLE